ncbi:MAG: hypothetical protein KGM47_08705 [Acidobacteriota bacterium]|nr:hypothetical protein [Acidobacteriota bacterium]
MNCHEAQPFVSTLHDGQSVPREAAEHIRSCSACHAQLEDYARMDVELRLLASSAPEEASTQMLHLPQLRRRWVPALTARVLVPRFALGAGVFAILSLSVGLGWMRAQSRGPWFQFDVSDAAEKARVGCLTQAGDDCEGSVTTGTDQKIGIRVKALDVRKDLVRLIVKARVFEPVPGNEEVKTKHQAGGLSQEVVDRMFANTTPQEFDYVPGQTLEIPVEGGGKVLLSGEVFKLRPSFPTQWYPLTLQPNEIALSKAALVRGNQFLGEIEGSGSARGENSAIGICVPPVGAFVFGLKPFEGAVEGVAEFGEVRFNLDGDQYTLFSATPITGGQQPREIWVYRSQNCPPSWKTTPKHPSMIGSGSITNVLDFLRK